MGIKEMGFEGQARMTAARVAITQAAAPLKVEEASAGSLPSSTATLEPSCEKALLHVCQRAQS
jgi:hypothetical protein